MKFLYPGFLWAFAALAIPVIIHLFNFRKYKVVYFSNLQFLKNLQEQTESRQKLKHLLVLLARLLAFSALVLAFAQPVIHAPKQADALSGLRSQVVSVYIDNSFSMGNSSAEGELFEIARNKARDIVKSYKENDRFQLLSNDFEGRQQRLLNRKDFLDLLDELKISPLSRKLSEVLARQKQACSKEPEKKKVFFLLSDFQESMLETALPEPDSSLQVYILPLKSVSENNLYLDSCWFSSPHVQAGQSNKLVIRVRNSGDEDADAVPITLKVDGVQKGLGSCQVKANSFTDTELSFTTGSGFHQAELKLSDHPLVFDDLLYFSFNVSPAVNILVLNGENANPYLQAVYAADSYCRVSQQAFGQTDYSSLASYDFIILNELATYSSGLAIEIKKYLQQGGQILLFPSPAASANTAQLQSWLSGFGIQVNGALVQTDENVFSLNSQDELLNDVFEKIPQNLELPKVKRYYNFAYNRVALAHDILSLRNRQPLLSRFRQGKGQIYLSAVPLNTEWSNLPQHAIFVPIMLKMAYLSQSQSPLYYVIGRENSILLPAAPREGEHVYKLQMGNEELIPQAEKQDGQNKLYLADLLKKPGNYNLKGTETPVFLAFNHSRAESAQRFASQSTLEELADKNHFSLLEPSEKSLGQLLQEKEKGQALWKLCIVLTLVFLLLEILLLKYYPA